MASNDEEAFKNANLLAGDAILNYRTVASLANDKAIVKAYDNYLEVPARAAINRAHVVGFWFGFAQFSVNAIYALLYWTGAQFAVQYPGTSQEDTFKIHMVMTYGAWAAG
jgi:ABC-type transport system involved in Fe-S cluster assembly fused permease/ATPase subunit